MNIISISKDHRLNINFFMYVNEIKQDRTQPFCVFYVESNYEFIPFGVEFLSVLSVFYVESHSAFSPFGVESILSSVNSRLSPFGVE
jgi:hypothetical protein